MQTPQAISNGDVLQRAGSIGLVVGGIATLVGDAMFPGTDDPGDVNARLAALGGDETTTLIAGLTILVGFWALLVGTMGIYRSITSANAAPWARMGFYGVIMATAVSSVTMGTLVGANDITADWVAAGGTAGTAGYAIVATLNEFVFGLFNVVIVANWLAFLAVGVGIVLSDAYPKYMGWSLVVLSAAVVVIGGPRFFIDLTETAELIFTVPAGLTSVWAVVMGVWVARRAW